MQKQKIVLIIGILILTAAGSLYLAVKSKSAQITTYEECEKAGWLVRGIKIYDGINGSAEKECFLWTSKSFVEQGGLSIQKKWGAKTDEQENVTVIVSPIDLSPQSQEWKFDISMNTHSVELDQDMAKSAVLIDSQDREFKPLNWDGSIGGHHREGILTFDQITPTPKYIELKISDIGTAVRNFTWDLLSN